MVGSANLDLAVAVARTPHPGETVGATALREGPGGKGLNQAVASARLGRSTAFVGAIGRDSAGQLLADAIARAGIQEALIRTDAPTGRAVVITDAAGESTIVVHPGANAELGPRAVASSGQLVRAARAVLVQLEIPDSAVESAAGLCSGLFVVNPAPARRLPPAAAARVDVLIPNRHELGTLAGGPAPTGSAEVSAAVARLGLRADVTVVVTLGDAGSLVVRKDRSEPVPAWPVASAVDATAAGDAFCAAYVDAALDGADEVEAATWASRVAAMTVSRAGAVDALPRRAEVLASTLLWGGDVDSM